MAKTLARIQDLFRQGEVIVLEPTDESGAVIDRIPLYVQKLSALERDEAIKDGRAARARRMLAFDRDEDEQVTIASMLQGFSDDELVADLLRERSGALFAKAQDEVRSDKAWKERLEALDRAQTAGDSNTTAAEQKLLLDLARELQVAIEKAHHRLMRQEKRDIEQEPREVLEQKYRTAWREMLGATAMWEGRRQTEIWFALRMCEVELGDDGPILSTLKVGDRLCETRAEVMDLPDEIVAKVTAVMEGEMTSREAGNSGAPSASSGSSEQRSAEAASQVSSPTEM